MKRKFSEEQIIGILREAEATGQNMDVCRKHGISEQTFYRWKKKFEGMDVAAKISEVATGVQGKMDDAPIKPVLIEKAEIVE